MTRYTTKDNKKKISILNFHSFCYIMYIFNTCPFANWFHHRNRIASKVMAKTIIMITGSHCLYRAIIDSFLAPHLYRLDSDAKFFDNSDTSVVFFLKKVCNDMNKVLTKCRRRNDKF